MKQRFWFREILLFLGLVALLIVPGVSTVYAAAPPSSDLYGLEDDDDMDDEEGEEEDEGDEQKSKPKPKAATSKNNKQVTQNDVKNLTKDQTLHSYECGRGHKGHHGRRGCRGKKGCGGGCHKGRRGRRGAKGCGGGCGKGRRARRGHRGAKGCSGGCGKGRRARGCRGKGRRGGQGCGGGCRRGKGHHGHGRGHGNHRHHRFYIQRLLDHHQGVKRNVTYLSNGIKSVTTSSNPTVVRYLQIHVAQMKRRMDMGRLVRWWDPFFQEMFANYRDISMKIRNIPNGIEVLETGRTKKAIALIHAHAQAVNKFALYGREEARKCHKLKKKTKE